MPSPQESLKAIIFDLIAELSDSVFNETDDEEDDMFKIKTFFEVMPSAQVASHVVREIIPHEDKIKARDQKFFEKNRMLFAGLPEDRIDYYMNIITTSDRIEEEDKMAVWEYFDTILALAKKCKKVE